MNIYSQFSALFNREHLAVAKISADMGGGSWAAKTQGGRDIVLTGSAAVGEGVFYDLNTRKITGQAPNLPVIDIAV